MIRIKDTKYHSCTLCRLNGTEREASWTSYGKYFCESCKKQEDAQIREYYADDKSTHHKEAPVDAESTVQGIVQA